LAVPAAGVTYSAFVDPSGGSEDAMTLAIAHKTTRPEERVIVDAVREVRPPFLPSVVVDDFAVLARRPRIANAVGGVVGAIASGAGTAWLNFIIDGWRPREKNIPEMKRINQTARS
jgi:hypothetical protein